MGGDKLTKKGIGIFRDVVEIEKDNAEGNARPIHEWSPDEVIEHYCKGEPSTHGVCYHCKKHRWLIRGYFCVGCVSGTYEPAK